MAPIYSVGRRLPTVCNQDDSYGSYDSMLTQPTPAIARAAVKHTEEDECSK